MRMTSKVVNSIFVNRSGRNEKS